jgi:hypothetical protein
MATTHRDEGVRRIDFGSRTGRTDGVGNRHERFLACGGTGIAHPLLLLMAVPVPVPVPVPFLLRD